MGTLDKTKGRQKTPLPAEFEELLGEYTAERARIMPANTVRTYGSAVRLYLAWVTTGTCDGDPLKDRAARDWAVRDYKGYLLTTVKRAPSTVNTALAAIDDFCDWLGLGPAQGSNGRRVKRQELPERAPRALSPRARTRYLRAVEDCPSARDRLMALLPLYAGLRVSEVAGLDLDDITMTARKGQIRILGKGQKVRSVPIHPKLREAIQAWKAVRPAGSNALFATRIGTRPTPEAVDDVIASITQKAGLDEHVTAHVLRHTFGTTMVRDGVDLPTVAGLMGHARIETTRRYAAPSEEDMEKAILRLPVDD
jgi:site-specific recombinase XerD